MKQEETSLDENILGLPPVHNWQLTYRQEIYGAFDITERGLLALESHLHNIISSIAPGNTTSEIVKVVFSGKPSEVYSSISEVIALRNPRTARITGINIRMTTTEGLASVWIDDIGLYSSHSIVLLFAAHSDKDFGKHETLIKRELKNLECWYSPIRKRFDRILSIAGKVPSVVYTALFYVGLASMIFFFFSDKAKHTQWRTASEKIVKEYDSLSKNEPNLDPNTVAQINEIKTTLEQYNSPGMIRLMNTVYVLAGSFIFFPCLIFAVRLFPRVVFEIGEGIRRQEQRVWLRRFVIGSIVICGIILPLVRKKLI